MAQFSNVATLSYNGLTLSSNTVTGEILETVSVEKTALSATYGPGEDLAYLITLTNSGTEAVTGLTVSDDLGGYAFDGGTVYPLAYVADSLRYFVNGVLQTAPAVTAGPPLTVTGISIPAGGSATLAYEVDVTAFAPLGAGAGITNTATVTGGGLTAPLTAQASVHAVTGADLRVTKAVSPNTVTPNGTLTYTFVIENSGAAAAEGPVLSDTFDPILNAPTVTYNGALWTPGTNYTYAAATGAFTTLAGQISVPAAAFAQNADGTWSVTPGTAVLTVAGTI